MRRILLCIDVQAGFVNEASAPVVGEIVRLAAEGGYDEIWATRFLNPGPSGSFHRRMGWRRFEPGSDEAMLVPEVLALKPRVFDKCSYSAGSDLLQAAAEAEPCDIHVAGIDTDVCVLTVATQLFDAGHPPHVIVNACRSHGGAEPHQAGLLVMRRILGSSSLIER